MTELHERISALLIASDHDIDRIERTLTDGYAHALALEAEKWRLEKRLGEIAKGIRGDDSETGPDELSTLAQRLDGNAGELVRLRTALGRLRRHADHVRVA